MVTPVLWGEFLVNTIKEGGQANVQMHALSNGRFVAVWENLSDDGVSTIFAQHFYAGAVPVGDPIQINTTPAESASNPVVTTLSDGRVVYAWEHRTLTGDVPTSSIRARIFNSDGTPFDRNGDVANGTEDFEVAAGVSGAVFGPKITALPGAGFVITYTHEPITGNLAATADGAQIKAAVFGATVIPSEMNVNEAATGIASNESVVGLGGGRFVALYRSYGTAGAPDKVHARIFTQDANGNPVPGAELVLSNSVKTDTDLSALALADGRFILTWTKEIAVPGVVGTHLDVIAQVFTADGMEDGPAITVNKVTQIDQHSPSVTALANGGFAIAYQDASTTDVPQIRVAVFDRNKNRIGDDTVVNNTSSTAEQRGTPKLIELKDGRLIAAWDETGGQGDDLGIRGQVIDARYEGINYTVTEDGDLPIGTQFGDTITGSSRNEYIDGGHGDDVLNGGGGNDVMMGSVGADRMDGGTGDDTYMVDNVGDVIIDASGIDTVRTTVSYALSANLENLIAEGSSAINLTGNGLNNTITGNDAANVIDGGAGADVMNGGGGDDTYVVDNAGDMITDTSGVDTVRTTISYALGMDLENLIAEGSAGIALTGNAFNNTITGNGGANKLYGDAGDDILNGNGGNDMLFGGLGNDVLAGGAGKDKFVFNSLPNKTANLDRIIDFNAKDDDVYLDNAIFKKLGKKGSESKPAKLNAKFFQLGSKAKDKDDYLVYDKKKGVLYYDADGSSKKIKPVEIAKFDNKAKMVAADFFVI